jgi:hypothetical protein
VSSERKEREKDNTETQRAQRRRRGRLRKKIYGDGDRDTEDAEFGGERTGNTGFTSRGGGDIEERFLAAQADRFAGANRCRKIGLLRSE